MIKYSMYTYEDLELEYSIIPLSWDRRTYLNYCESLMMIPNNIVIRLYRNHTGHTIHSLSQLTNSIIRSSRIDYFKPHQLVDIELYLENNKD